MNEEEYNYVQTEKQKLKHRKIGKEKTNKET